MTLKRGTTEAGIDVLNRRETPAALSLAVQAAYRRAAELSFELDPPSSQA